MKTKGRIFKAVLWAGLFLVMSCVMPMVSAVLPVFDGYANQAFAGQIKGTVFNDTNQNGTQDAGELGIAYITKLMVDEGIVLKNPQIMVIAPVGMVLVVLIRGLAAFVSQWSLNWVGRRVIFDIRNQLFKKMVRLPTSYYDMHPSSSLISKLIYDVEQLAQAATSVIFSALKDGLTVVYLFAYLGFMSWKITLIFLIAFPLVANVVQKMSHKLRTTSKNIQDSVGGIVKQTQEASAAHKIIKIFGAQDYETERFASANNFNRQQAMKQITVTILGTPIVETLASLAVAGVIYTALHEVQQGHMTAGDFISYLSAMLLLLAPTKRLTGTNQAIQRGLAASQSAFSVLDEHAEPDSGTMTLERVDGKIEYRHVSFAYQSSTTPVLSDVNFTIEPGMMVALVGASGSGKSTIASLLPRFYQLEQGGIFIDGQNINDLTLENLRQHIALISQETILFDDTIANNICYGRAENNEEADWDRLTEAAIAAHVLEFTDKLPDKLDTMVGEKGLRLSGGQRQRIAIARAIYKNASILVMDEATSALDTESERHVQAAMEKLMKDRSTLVIAHRLSTIERADRIIVMDGGRIAEIGTHDELLKREGIYARLQQLQFEEIPS